MAKPHPNDARAPELIDEYIATHDDWRGERIAQVRALIKEAFPEVRETFKWRGNPVWEHEGILVVAGAFKSKVKLTFQHGAHIEDPKSLFNNGLDGKEWRAIDMDEDHVLDENAFRDLVRAAVAYNES